MISAAPVLLAQIRISGHISSKNRGIANVNVSLKDSYDGATSDSHGNYSFETMEKGSHILEFSLDNYEIHQKKS